MFSLIRLAAFYHSAFYIDKLITQLPEYYVFQLTFAF